MTRARPAERDRNELVISCEHGGNRVPVAYRSHFCGFEHLLATHRGYDPGALTTARHLARLFGVPLFAATTTRLLVDLNRSIGHRALYSEVTRPLPPAERQAILERYYLPYRNRVEDCVTRCVAEGRRVIHVSCHSFTPVLDGEVRQGDIGLLYDPARAAELRFCARWQAHLRTAGQQLRVRRNYPYHGRSDGLVTHLRRRFLGSVYVGVELEINQRLVASPQWRWLCEQIAASLQSTLDVDCFEPS